MTTFIRAAQDIKRGTPKLHPKEQEYFDLVFRARTLLQHTLSKSALDINNIESLFGVFDMATLLGRLGPMTDEEIQKLPTAINYVISKTIESSLQYPIYSGSTLAPKPYGAFAGMIHDLNKRDRGSVSVITFNYDVGLDYAFHYASIPFEYRCGVPDGLDPGRKQFYGAIDLLKLHGSLNWGRCKQCNGRVVPYLLKDFFSNHDDWAPTLDKPQTRTLEIANFLVQRSCPACGTPLAENPVIVPPTWNKGNAHSGLSSVWRAAATHLAEAENVFVIGYSLPGTDEFFRYFYALSTVGESVLDTFLVVDKDKRVFDRFKSILGPTAIACFSSIENAFENAIPQLRTHLNLPA